MSVEKVYTEDKVLKMSLMRDEEKLLKSLNHQVANPVTRLETVRLEAD